MIIKTKTELILATLIAAALAILGLSQINRDKRIEKAKKLLKDTNQSIVEIAYHLGFNDQSHFSNTFKRYVDITPKKYRES